MVLEVLEVLVVEALLTTTRLPGGEISSFLANESHGDGGEGGSRFRSTGGWTYLRADVEMRCLGHRGSMECSGYFFPQLVLEVCDGERQFSALSRLLGHPNHDLRTTA